MFDIFTVPFITTIVSFMGVFRTHALPLSTLAGFLVQCVHDSHGFIGERNGALLKVRLSVNAAQLSLVRARPSAPARTLPCLRTPRSRSHRPAGAPCTQPSQIEPPKRAAQLSDMFEPDVCVGETIQKGLVAEDAHGHPRGRDGGYVQLTNRGRVDGTQVVDVNFGKGRCLRQVRAVHCPDTCASPASC